MSRSIRLAVIAGAALVTLAFAGPALAVYKPQLTVTSTKNAPGAKTSIILGHIQTDADDPTAKDTIYAPLGYGVTLGQPTGTTIGHISARLIFRNGGNTTADVVGDVIADDPAAHPSDQCAPGVHGAVWKLNITVAGSPLTVFVYVDAITSGPKATFASAEIQLCLAGPIGTPLGAQLLFAVFDVNGIFTNPSTTTDRLWRGIFTPYTPGTPNPNPGATIEGQALVPGRVAFTAKAKSLRHGRVVISGRLLVDGTPVSGVTVDLYVPNKVKAIAHAKTNRKGQYTFKKRKIKKKTRFLVEMIFIKALPACPVAPLPTVPQGCGGATTSAYGAAIVTGRKRR